jgi:hypothetical protein
LQPGDFLGQATQRPPSCANAAAALEKELCRSLAVKQKRMMTLKGALPERRGSTGTSAAISAMVESAVRGALSAATRWPGLIPSFLGSGVPE